MREALDVGQSRLKLGQDREHAIRLVLCAKTLGNLACVLVLTAHKSNRPRGKHGTCLRVIYRFPVHGSKPAGSLHIPPAAPPPPPGSSWPEPRSHGGEPRAGPALQWHPTLEPCAVHPPSALTCPGSPALPPPRSYRP